MIKRFVHSSTRRHGALFSKCCISNTHISHHYNKRLFPDQKDLEKLKNYNEEEHMEKTLTRLQAAKIQAVRHKDEQLADITEENTLKTLSNLTKAFEKYSDRVPNHDEMNRLIHVKLDAAVKYVLKSVVVYNQEISDKSFTMLEHPERAGLELDPMESYDFDTLAATDDPTLKSYDPQYHGHSPEQSTQLKASSEAPRNYHIEMEDSLLAESTYQRFVREIVIPQIKEYYEHYTERFDAKLEPPLVGFNDVIFGFLETIDKQIGLLLDEVSGVHLPEHLTKHFKITPKTNLYNGILDIVIEVHNPQVLAQFLTSMQKKDIGLNEESYIILARQALKNMDSQYIANLMRYMEANKIEICDEIKDLYEFVLENGDEESNTEYVYVPKQGEKIDFSKGIKRYGY